MALEEGGESPAHIGFQSLATPHVVSGTGKVLMEVIPLRTVDDMTDAMQRILKERMRDHRSSPARTREAIFGR